MRIINLDRYQTKCAGKEDTREDRRQGSDFESTVIITLNWISSAEAAAL